MSWWGHHEVQKRELRSLTLGEQSQVPVHAGGRQGPGDPGVYQVGGS